MSDEIETTNSESLETHDRQFQDEDVALSRYAKTQYYDLFSPVSFAPYVPRDEMPDGVAPSGDEFGDLNGNGSSSDEVAAVTGIASIATASAGLPVASAVLGTAAVISAYRGASEGGGNFSQGDGS